MTIAAIIVAAGCGSRCGETGVPKQYLPLACGTMILRRTLAVFRAHGAIDLVQAVIRDQDRALLAEAARGLHVLPPVIGGAKRRDSVRKGLEALRTADVTQVLVHDGARPFVSFSVIDRVLAALANAEGAFPGVTPTDALHQVKDGVVTNSPPRTDLWCAQTPQGFHFDRLLRLHQRAGDDRDADDDIALLVADGGTAHMVDGDPGNHKITYAADLARRAPATAKQPRVGSGFDVHAFDTDKSTITLCGIDVPFCCGLRGHSDADVALHALTDALYGTIAAGDIGRHFPPDAPRWKNAPSHIFLAHAHALITALGGELSHVDVTIVCEHPKIGPHRAAMARRLSEILHLAVDRISIKATTTERLGFIGRQEGVAAMATSTVLMPVS